MLSPLLCFSVIIVIVTQTLWYIFVGVPFFLFKIGVFAFCRMCLRHVAECRVVLDRFNSQCRHRTSVCTMILFEHVNVIKMQLPIRNKRTNYTRFNGLWWINSFFFPFNTEPKFYSKNVVNPFKEKCTRNWFEFTLLLCLNADKYNNHGILDKDQGSHTEWIPLTLFDVFVIRVIWCLMCDRIDRAYSL